MLKKIGFIALAATLSFNAMAGTELKTYMQDMSKAMKAFEAAESQKEAVAALDDLMGATYYARNEYPENFVENKENTEAYDKHYRAMIQELNTMAELLENNKLDEAKDNLDKLAELRAAAHKEFKK